MSSDQHLPIFARISLPVREKLEIQTVGRLPLWEIIIEWDKYKRIMKQGINETNTAEVLDYPESYTNNYR